MASAPQTNHPDETMPSHYPASHTALLLLDFHTAFLSHMPEDKALAALSAASTTRKWAKTQNIQVIHCLIDPTLPPFPTCKDKHRIASIVEAFASGGAEEPAVLREGTEDDKTFLRRGGYVSALKSPGLVDFLRERGIVSLVLAGLSTSGCVLRTAVAASDEEFVVSVLEDGCADGKGEVHAVLVGEVLPGRGYVYTCKAFREGWEERTLGLEGGRNKTR